MPSVTLYHNPRCSKSRAALALLEENGCDVTIVEYLKTPPSVADLDILLDMLGLEPRDMMRRDEEEYQSLALGRPELAREQLLAAIHEHPRLLQRPVAVLGSRAVIGRPPEQVLELL